jgi:hypothetical protein
MDLYWTGMASPQIMDMFGLGAGAKKEQVPKTKGDMIPVRMEDEEGDGDGGAMITVLGTGWSCASG